MFLKNIIRVISVIIGTLIGAGFASGKEIEIFFCKYGTYGIAGIILSAFLIGIIVYVIFLICEKLKIETYDQFLDYILEKNLKNKNGKLIIYVIKNIINLFLLISFFIMIAGFGSYFYQEFSISPIWGAGILAFMCYLTFNRGINGITKISSILIPFLIGFIIVLGIKNVKFVQIPTENVYSSKGWWISGVLYGSYNSILLIPILFPLKKYITNIKINKKSSIILVVIIILLATIIYDIVIENYLEIINIEIPMVYIVGKNNVFFKKIYSILILISIYTSAISAGYSFLENTVRKSNRKMVSIIICIISVLVSKIGFSYLINLIYPILGILGLIQLYQILKCWKNT